MESESNSDSLSRRGLAFQLEHGFYKTPIGIETYAMNLKQIQESCLETIQYGVMHSVLGSNNTYKSWILQHGDVSSRIEDVYKHRKQEFAIVQRDPRGLYVCDSLIKDRMRERGIVPTLWVLAPRVAIYFSMVPDFQTEYYRKGPQSQQQLEQGPSQLSSFRSTKVVECRKFDVDFVDKPHCPLSRVRQIGSYWVLEPDQSYITIFDLDKDAWVTLSRNELKITGDSSTPLASDRLLIMRPSETYRMSSGILVAPGKEYAQTFVGNNDFMLSDNALSKTHVGHYTFYSKTVVKVSCAYFVNCFLNLV